MRCGAEEAPGGGRASRASMCAAFFPGTPPSAGEGPWQVGVPFRLTRHPQRCDGFPVLLRHGEVPCLPSRSPARHLRIIGRLEPHPRRVLGGIKK